MAKYSPTDIQPAPEPLPPLLPPVESLTPELLPDTLRPWLVDVAERLNVPLDFPAAAALTVVSIAIGRRVAICPQKAGDWVVIPNLWGALVGRPGSKKSPTLGAVMAPMNRLIGNAKREFAEAMKEHEQNALGIQCEIDGLKADLKKLAKSDKDEEKIRLRKKMADLKGALKLPAERRFKTNDPTIEALTALLEANPHGLLVERDELMGWLRGMEKQGHEQDRAFYLEAWNGNGGFFESDRIGRGHLTVENPCVTVFGGIQPDRLRRYVMDALQGDGDGLLQRFQLAVWPDMPPLKPVDRKPDQNALNAAVAVFERLSNINPQHIEAASDFSFLVTDGPPGLRFDDEAQARFTGWKTALDRRVRSEQMPEIIAAHLDKFGSLVASLALIFHLCDRHPVDLRVPLHQLERAIGWAGVLETHARRIYSDALTPGAAASHAIVQRIIDGQLLADGITCRDIQRHGWQSLQHTATVQAGLDTLVQCGWLLEHQRAPGEHGGRPTTDYTLNPKAWNEDADGNTTAKLGFGSSAGESLGGKMEMAA